LGDRLPIKKSLIGVTLQITLITQENKKTFQSMVARPVTKHLSAQSKMAINQVFGSSYSSNTFCKSALGASIAA
jgi:hypothetical protein